MNDVLGLFRDSRIEEVFSSEGLGALAGMRFWEFPVFYILSFKTFVYIFLVLKGRAMDLRDLSRVAPLQEGPKIRVF